MIRYTEHHTIMHTFISQLPIFFSPINFLISIILVYNKALSTDRTMKINNRVSFVFLLPKDDISFYIFLFTAIQPCTVQACSLLKSTINIVVQWLTPNLTVSCDKTMLIEPKRSLRNKYDFTVTYLAYRKKLNLFTSEINWDFKCHKKWVFLCF